jgi:hypothetical protein
MEWRRAWYSGTLRPVDWIYVDEAIGLRTPGSTKVGDTYCCECKQIRISPVDAKTRYFRRHRQSPDNIEHRNQCVEVRKSIEQGETWKHTQIVAEIMQYLLSDEGKSLHSISNIVKAGGIHRNEADLIVTHSEKIPHFDSTEVRILVRMWNWRRQRELLAKYPNSIVIQVHRWPNTQITDVGFPKLVKKYVDEAYQMDAKDRLEYYHSSNHKSYIPNLQYWNFNIRKSNKQRMIQISSSEQNEEIVSTLQSMEKLLDRVIEHNRWCIQNDGMEKYHLKHLKFQDYVGIGLHPNPTIDAILSHAENFCESSYEPINIEIYKKINRWSLNNVGKFWISPMDVMKIASAPGMWMKWGDLLPIQKKKCIEYAKNKYRDETYQKLPSGQIIPLVMNPLVKISEKNSPQILHDTNGLEKFIEGYTISTNDDLEPLSLDEYRKVQFYVSADKWMKGLSPRHPIYESLLHERIHSM